MADTTIVIEILTGIALFIFIGLHIESLHDVKCYKKYYDLMNRDEYKFEPHDGLSSVFRKYVYDRTSGQNRPIDESIIFFPDGDIKLNENLYIWKLTWMGLNLFRWYYLRKFNNLKDEKIREYNIRESFRRSRESLQSHLYERYMRDYGGTTTQSKTDFKFLRG